MDYNIVVRRDTDGQYIARNLEVWVVSQWLTIEEALANVKEATELYLEDEDTSSLFSKQAFVRPAFLTSFKKVWQGLAIHE